MSDDQSARLRLPYLAAGQMQKHVTLNEALTRLDALVQAAVISRSIAIQPAAPSEGDLYIVPDVAEGASWSTRPAGDLVRAEAGAWTSVATVEGMLVFVADSREFVVRRAGGWTSFGETLAEVGPLTRLGLGTLADADNPFSVKLNKALWTAREAGDGGDGSLRLTLNKTAASNVLSLLFQSAYGGRAELGLVGDDDLTLKVSADGATWTTAFDVERGTGRVSFPQGAGRRETTVLLTDGDWSPPAWARSVEAVVVGGGGGGSAGAFGPSGDRYGGGGGGAGGIGCATWPVEQLTAGLVIIVGAGGNGGDSAAGADGGRSSIALGGISILAADGGEGGRVGSSSAGEGGRGGAGAPRANDGGHSSVVAAAESGRSLDRPDSAGGGGGGGGLSRAGISHAGGAGGDGGALAVKASGGLGGSDGGGWGGWAAPLLGLHWAGGGGGGGGAAASGAGHDGGDGGGAGAGGGGGGAGVTDNGAGGTGAAGLVRLTAVG